MRRSGWRVFFKVRRDGRACNRQEAQGESRMRPKRRSSNNVPVQLLRFRDLGVPSIGILYSFLTLLLLLLSGSDQWGSV